MSAGDLLYTLVVRHPETLLPEALLVGTKVPDWAKDLVDGGNVEGGSSKGKAGKKNADPDPGSAAPAGKYDDLDVEALKAEIDQRNEGREDDAKLSKRGGKDTLAAALEADDATNV